MTNLNLEFSGNVLRILQLSEAKEIISKGEADLSFNIGDDLYTKKNKNELVAEFEEAVNSILKGDTAETKNAGILIGTEQTFLNVLPVDFNEEQNNINSHILWELSNHFPGTYKDFTIKYYRLNNSYMDGNIDEALLIAVNKKKIEFIKNLCNASNIKIKNVEIDQFAVEKCLREYYYEEIKSKTILVIGCKGDRLDFSLIVNGNLKYYDYDILEIENFKNSLVDQMNFYNSSFLNIDRIFLYGNISLEVKDFLKENFPDVFVSYIYYSDKSADTKFSPLYGLALKNLDQ